MFDTVSGLPVHILVVHAAVVLIPLMALVTFAFIVRPAWRGGLSWAVLGNLVALGAAFAAKESGEKLQARLSNQAGQLVAGDHAELGDKLPYFALAALVAAVIAWFLVGRSTTTSAEEGRSGHRASGVSGAAVVTAAVLVLVAGGAATVWTVRVGDSGSRAAWEDTIANTKAP
jgi:hypothetical protein